MTEPLFDIDELDRLGEVVNIAMGRAGAALAEAFTGFVHLRVPELRTVDAAAASTTRQRLEQNHQRISVLQQEFFGELAGDVAVIYGEASYAVLREVLGFDGRDGDGQRQREELLLELGNALTSTMIAGIGEQLKLRTGLRAPRVVLFDTPVQEALAHLFDDMPIWSRQTLQIAIVFHLEAHQVPFELLITLAPDCLPLVHRALAVPV